MISKTKRQIPFAVAILVILFSACTQNARLARFWDVNDVTVTQDNYREAEDRFAVFCELAASATPEKASEALDKLMDKLSSDEVSYYVYSEWIVSAFHSILSPCRNPEVFAKAVERFCNDGIMSADECAPLCELAAKDKFNNAGSASTIPPLFDAAGEPAPWQPGKETLFAVINLDCATCVGALRSLEKEPGEHIALCFGNTPAPSVPGWQYRYSPELGKIFDLDAAPFWFTVGADGVVVKPISFTPGYNAFATPDNE